MIKGTGIDIIEVERVGEAIKDEHFLQRVFTQGERALLAERKGSAQTAAGIFAAKEATVKALGRGFGMIRFTDVEVIHDEYGVPEILLCGQAKERFLEMGGQAVHISISHIEKTAVAQCMIEGGAPTCIKL